MASALGKSYLDEGGATGLIASATCSVESLLPLGCVFL